jgi:hypothetical protein
MKNLISGLLLFLISFFVTYNSINRDLPQTDYRERAVGMTAELDKEKTYDHKHKVFALMLTIKIYKKDLFIFNENIQTLRDDFYQLVTNSKGQIMMEDIITLKQLFSAVLIKSNVEFIDIKVVIEDRN